MVLPIPSLSSVRQKQAKEYARKRRKFFFLDIALTLAFLLLLIFSGLSLLLRDLLAFPMPLTVAIYMAALLMGYSVLLLPSNLYAGFVLPRRYGLLVQGWLGWLLDRAKGAILEIALGSAILVLLYWLMGRFPDIWWLWATLLVLLLTILLTNLAPIVILPLFFRLSPLKDSDLAQGLMRLAEKAGVRACGVFTMDFSRKATGANAGLMGLGNTRRIVLTDTLLQSPAEEIEVVLAHELGHHLHNDIWRLIGIQSVSALAGFYILSLVSEPLLPLLGYHGLTDIAALPWLGLFFFIYFMLLAPLFNVYSRHLERGADRYALELTGKPEAFVSMMARLTDQNLSEAEPDRWVELLFYDHPSYFRRVAEARAYAEGAG
jgi:STE24 endopeptidase